ncbi:MAG TPA: long-chain-acyl-CoA synthetase, partial [Steroidobacteraceae bacterium]|nr:long-chain-acyl-CoA synthetase [Steroidobacteraceae bacterium]
ESMRSPLKAWVRALERTAAIGRDPTLTLPVVIGRLADRLGDSPALLAPESRLSYRALAEGANRFARWGLAQRLARGDVICLLTKNCPEYLAIWLGLSRIGVTVALINTNLTGELLRHSIDIAHPRHVIVGASLGSVVVGARARLDAGVVCWSYGDGSLGLPRLDLEVEGLPGTPLGAAECPLPTLAERALYIYTSGTTGLPKAANVSHLRLMQWSHWFAGLADIRESDRLFNCLPMYHSVGGVVATGAALVAGGAVVVRERFSVSSFWRDVIAERCTLFQYIGELCRYLLNAPSETREATHELRLACGNGLRGEVWEPFQRRFRIPHILEYYASTEGNFSLYNCEGRVGAIGRIPPFLAHRIPVAIVKHDLDTGAPARDVQGRCIPCASGEAGEAIGQILDTDGGTRFEGYADSEASGKKVLRNVFAGGDTWYRTGDLMRRDEQGFFYFVDRVGDTFRWKGENVSTTEVAAAISGCQGVAEVAVYGVAVPKADGRAGMAALVVGADFDLAELRRTVATVLPAYARPVFVRVAAALEITGTFKLRTQELARQGYDPGQVSDALYLDDAARGEYVRLDATLYRRIVTGAQRV